MEKHIFEKKVLESEQTLYRIAKSMLFCEKDCEDVVQDAILNAFIKLNTLNQENYFKTWLVRILINECNKKKSKFKDTVPFEDFFANIPVEEKDDYSELYQAIMELKEKVRLPIVLHYIEGYSVEEIKDILKIPSGTVKSRLYKGRNQLKLILEDVGGYYEQIQL